MDESLYGQFAEVAEHHWWFEGRRQVVRAAIAPAMAGLTPTGERLEILDVGCGTGAMLGMLGEFGAVSGLEMEPAAIATCHELYGDAVTVLQGSVPDDVPGDGRIDVVTAFDVIEHLDDDLGAVQRLCEAVRPGGLFVSTVPAFPSLWGQQDVISHHKRRYRRGPYVELIESAGLTVERCTYFNTWLFPVAAAVRLGRRVLPEKDGAPGSDLSTSGPKLDGLLTRIFASERHLVRRTSLPVGVPILVIARRPG